MLWQRETDADFLEGLKRYGKAGRSFTVVDENGDTYTLRIVAWHGGIALFNDKGLIAQRVSKGVYKLSDGVTTIRATSDDPDAP
jgi:hypothetical protein